MLQEKIMLRGTDVEKTQKIMRSMGICLDEMKLILNVKKTYAHKSTQVEYQLC